MMDLNQATTNWPRTRAKELIRFSAVRAYALERARTTRRTANFTRMSNKTLMGLAADFMIHIDYVVHRSPSRGRTL